MIIARHRSLRAARTWISCRRTFGIMLLFSPGPCLLAIIAAANTLHG